MKTFLIAITLAFAATPAFAVSTCAEFNGLSGDAKLSTVASLKEAEPGLFDAEGRVNQATQQIEAICASDPEKSLVEAAREQTNVNLQDG